MFIYKCDYCGVTTRTDSPEAPNWLSVETTVRGVSVLLHFEKLSHLTKHLERLLPPVRL